MPNSVRNDNDGIVWLIDFNFHDAILPNVKRKPGKPHAKALHQPIPELVKAEGMPKKKRCKPINRRRKETWAEILKSMKAALKP